MIIRYDNFLGVLYLLMAQTWECKEILAWILIFSLFLKVLKSVEF